MSTYEVVVGNIGTVYTGGNRQQALDDFATYREQSATGRGRAGGEEVMLIKDGEIVREFYPLCPECQQPVNRHTSVCSQGRD